MEKEARKRGASLSLVGSTPGLKKQPTTWDTASVYIQARRHFSKCQDAHLGRFGYTTFLNYSKFSTSRHGIHFLFFTALNMYNVRVKYP